MIGKAALFAALLGVGLSPAMAQDGEAAPPPDAEETVAEPADETSTATEGTAPPPDAMFLISGSDSVLARYPIDAPIDRLAEFCLEGGEEAILFSTYATIQLTGQGCFVPAREERLAMRLEDQIRDELIEDNPPQAMPAPSSGGQPLRGVVVSRSDEMAGTLPVGGTFLADGSICLEAGQSVTVLAQGRTRVFNGPRCIREMQRGPTRSAARPAAAASGRPRAGTVRGARGGRSTPLIFRISGGTTSALDRYPRGKVVKRGSQVCLNDNEQIDIVSNAGQRVSYQGPGCAVRNARPSATNIGGFTFG